MELKGIRGRSLDSRRADFCGRSLTGSRFEDVNLKQASFKRSNLNQAVFVRCNLSGCDFTHCELVCAVFDKCLLRATNFSGACLDHTDFRTSEICGMIISLKDRSRGGILTQKQLDMIVGGFQVADST